MKDDGRFTLELAKEDFKFSSAHFTVFAADDAELLHGHNYQVRVELTGRRLDEEGMLASFVVVKKAIRAICERLDSRTLIPTGNRHLEIAEDGDGVTVRFGERRYRVPLSDVEVLPIENTSIELMARMFWHELLPVLEGTYVESFGVHVAETKGQGCWYHAPIDGAVDGAETE